MSVRAPRSEDDGDDSHYTWGRALDLGPVRGTRWVRIVEALWGGVGKEKGKGTTFKRTSTPKPQLWNDPGPDVHSSPSSRTREPMTMQMRWQACPSPSPWHKNEIQILFCLLQGYPESGSWYLQLHLLIFIPYFCYSIYMSLIPVVWLYQVLSRGRIWHLLYLVLEILFSYPSA